jgi:Na+-driven multidrug efflux pump
MLVSLGTTFFVTVPLAYALAFRAGLGPRGLWIAFLAGSVVITSVTGLYMATGRWTRRAVLLSQLSPPV